ncbi:MAG: hypothetical protein KTR32_25820 [Granulosicoccus sp.]|nr:hypothetical protein [Granulosicoccus sp.]
MPRTLDFRTAGDTFQCELTTVDRSKLYGSVSVETLDADGNRCELSTLAIDGKTLIPYGGTASGYVNADGDWIPRKELVAVDDDGEPLPVVKSTFDAPVDLDQKVSPEEFLNHSVRLTYWLGTTAELPKKIKKSLESGDIYRFEFSYRGGVDTDPAFILAAEPQSDGDADSLWMLVTDENAVEFVTLEQAAVCTTNSQQDIDEAEEDEEELDFGML